MRVALVVYGSLRQRSGGYLYDRMLARHLREGGDEVEVVSLARRPFHRALFQNFTRLPARLAHLDPDLILEDELCHPSLCWINAAIARRLKRPLVAIVHHLRVAERPDHALGRAVERRYLATLDAAVVNSAATGASVDALLGRPLRQEIALPGRDRLGMLSRAAVVARARQAGPLRVVTVGNLEPRKNLETLVAALARLPRGAWRLTICGGTASSRYARRLRRLVAASGLDEAVTFSGPLANADLARLLAQADVFAQPSWYEGFGIAALEAMGFGVPAIVSEAGGANEVVVDTENGFLVAPNDIGAIARAFCALLDPEKRTAMSLAALERYNRHPTWRESMERARAFLTALV